MNKLLNIIIIMEYMKTVNLIDTKKYIYIYNKSGLNIKLN